MKSSKNTSKLTCKNLLIVEPVCSFGSFTSTKIINPQEHPFHIVRPSPWPILLSFSLGNSLTYFVFWMHNIVSPVCPFLNVMPYNIALALFSIISWFWDIIIEATFEGRHTIAVQRGLRIGFILFLVSEVLFFFSFFWAYFYVSISPSIWIGAVWPPLGIKPIDPWGLPLLNTAILLSSGITVTWAHKAIVSGHLPQVGGEDAESNISGPDLVQNKDFTGSELLPARTVVTKALVYTILLGLLFTFIQLYEYKHALFSINDGIYGSVFYILTGFHGFHVLVGTIFLTVCLLRHLAFHFTRDRHLGFEFAIWYWHFVDIIWIFLYVFVYVYA